MKITTIGFWGAYPGQDSATSCYLIEQDNFRLVIDLGSGALSKLQKYTDIPSINAVVISHFHNDHIADVGAFQYACFVQQQLGNLSRSVPIYAGKDEAENFASLNHEATEAVPIPKNQAFTVGPFKIETTMTEHPRPCYALKISNQDRTIVYTADTAYFDELVDFSREANLLIAECSFYKGMDGSGPGHMTSEECGTLASSANVGSMWLTHLPHFGDHQQLLQEAKEVYTGLVKLTSEGQTWES
ncbi:hypothetical protein CEY16_00635 [Halalkalibacillus sediminis]|uniref:Metallo-beta-lactamase domain-containing protein n=1 Tax=Halalkalibacillus sediminis TaxID=2018042 RepID=A0A2I0QVE6_9BACI|nr:MBL fold metallo-hydrolase [Halalkalibacillus sediminis]PKR78298.1 hypothetical protein CEY16_00635 [Halalkalibacillus sediminis]